MLAACHTSCSRASTSGNHWPVIHRWSDALEIDKHNFNSLIWSKSVTININTIKYIFNWRCFLGNANDKYLGTERVWNKRKCAQHPCGCGPKWHGIFDAWWVQVCRLHTQGCGLVVLRPNLTHGTKGSFRLDALGSRQGFRVFFVAWGASFLI